VDLVSAEAPQDGRHRAPSPSVACIDPKLTLLWPSPPASPSEVESSVDGDWSTYDDLLQDSTPTRVEEGEGIAQAETGSNGPNMQPPNTGKSSPSNERRTTRSIQTQVNTRAAARNSTGKAMVKGEGQQAEGIEKIHMKLWKCRIGGCNKTFHRKGDAVRHLQTTARHNGRAVVCSCGAPFSRHDALKRHQRLCNGPVN